jgi:transposase
MGWTPPCSCPTQPHSWFGATRIRSIPCHALSIALKPLQQSAPTSARTRSTSSVSTGMARTFCVRNFHAGKSRLGSRTCRPASSAWSRAFGAHHLSRQLKAHSHGARLMPARYVRPYSKGQKNDFRDAEAIAGAVLRPTMKFVAIKTVEQLGLQALHRVRERLVCQRTSVINQICAFLLERGIAVRQGLRALRTEMPIILAMTDKLSPCMIHMMEALCMDWRHLDGRIETVSDEIKTLSEQDDGAKRLMTVPGIGPIISTATVAAIGSGDAFSKGRDFGAWLGLVPRQMSTGGRTILGPISKRGNRYLRMLFVQAARAVLLRPQSWKKHGLKSWIEAAARRLNRFKLAIALARLGRSPWWSQFRSQADQACIPSRVTWCEGIAAGQIKQLITAKKRDVSATIVLPTEVCERKRRDGEMVFPAPPRTDDPNSPSRHGR